MIPRGWKMFYAIPKMRKKKARKIKMRKKSVIKKLLALTLTAGLLLTGCGSSDSGSASSADAGSDASGEKSVVRVGVMTGIAEHLIAALGQEKGIWEKNGVDLQVTEFATGVEAIGLVQMGQIDIAEIMDYAIVNRIGTTAKDTNLRIYEINYRSASDREDTTAVNKFYVNPETVSGEDDLKGKRISVSLGTVNEYNIAKVLEKEGLTKDDVTYVPIEGIQANIALATNGEIDATWAGGQTAEKLIELGWTPFFSEAEIGLNARNIGVVSDTFAKDPALEKYIKARAEIIKYYLENKDEAASVISKKTTVKEELVKSTLDGNDYNILLDQAELDHLNELKEWALNNGNYEEDFDLKSFIDTTALAKVYPDLVKI